ncbi:aminotransferase class I/II-fold pyridoxal phosphate-dependent enzyme [Foetidibacter luteolus]|uniref:aminotransferase class I/II-fold pyridoxal phosphate-dependent enzyme n=1 Tax=Foetidibacter luteolus TaxID=2608880 RepID=UPI00129B9696|nr:aminotransferase class I/II-fold pyridoxal phosphate-dependent enzyme [Foetidibacter luteolus]
MKKLNLTAQPGRTALAEDGKEYLFFSGYSYLGMGHVPEFAQLVREGMNRYGLLFPSSRISNTRLSLYEECEALLSEITGTEETVLVASGYQAGNMAVDVWKQPVHNYPSAHPAIQYNGNYAPGGLNITATDSVNVLKAAITDFAQITERCDYLVIDDSHGFGLLGEKGEGIACILPKNNAAQYVLNYSLSKACNINAGAISCPAAVADKLRALPAYTASTAPAPALLHAFINGQQLYRLQLNKLRENIRYFIALAGQLPGVTYHPQLPVFILPASVNEQALLEDGIIISSFAYPNASGPTIKRIVLNALHTKEDMERLARSLCKLLL